MNNVIENIRGRLRTGTVYREHWRVQDRSKINNMRNGKASAKKNHARGEEIRYIRGLLQ